MGYTNAMGMKPASGAAKSSCGCGPATQNGPSMMGEGALQNNELVQGISVEEVMNTDWIVNQGATSEQLICFTDLVMGPEVKCIKAPSTLVFQKSQKPCYKANDLIRVLGLDDCSSDSTMLFKVVSDPTLVDGLWEMVIGVDDTTAPVGPDPAVAFAGLQYEDGRYCFSGQTTTPQPIGCVAEKPAPPENPPRLMVHIPANNLGLTGGVFIEHDSFEEIGITFNGGYEATLANSVIGRVQVGDTIMSQEAGVCVPNRVLEVRDIEVMKDGGEGTEIIQRLYLEKYVPSSRCVLSQVRRGLTIDLEIQQDGPCWRAVIPAYDTARFPLDPKWKKEQGYYVGQYTISITYGTMRNGHLAPRSEVIKAGNVYIRPSHMFSHPGMCDVK